jgi:hypothetical protein
MDLDARRAYRVTAALRLATSHALWYVDAGVKVSEGNLQAAARAYEEQIYPRLTEAFGGLGLPPGGRLTILHTPLRGVAAYVGGADWYPPAVHPYSNQRPILYISTAGAPVGSREYLATLAHELQHVIHQAADPTEEAWVNEGLSELAADVAGYASPNLRIADRGGTVSLIQWPDSSPSVGRHYAVAHRFFRYLTQHYGGLGNLTLLLQEPQDSAAGVEAYLRRLNTPATFKDVFGAWSVANLLGSRGPGFYGYREPVAPITPGHTLRGSGSLEGAVQPFATAYIRLEPAPGSSRGAATLQFRGQPNTPLLPTRPPSGSRCWWSNRGDSIHSRLTRELDLRGVSSGALEFQAWYAIEEAWDYAYVTVSADGGRSWQALPGTHTVAENPLGNSYGPGLTGASPGWVRERMDLTPYAGNRVLLSFEYVTDDAVNLDGLCVDDIAVPEIGFRDDAEGDAGWAADGFVRTDNTLAQEYQLYVVELPRNGEPRVRPVPLGPDNTAELHLEGFGSELEAAVAVISSVTPATSQPAAFTLTLRQDG